MCEKKYKLSVGAIFKNEEHALVEWIEHYLLHGAEHFYLINDSSTDNSVEKIQKYIDNKIVTLFEPDHWSYYLGRQRDMYNSYILPHLKESEWLLIVDLDEFVWSKLFLNLTTLLDIYKPRFGQIQVNNTIYGSSGHVHQPESIIKNFLHRHAEYPTESYGYKNLKYFVNSDYEFSSLNVHHATFADLENEKEKFRMIDDPYFIMNHYCCQSFEFWKNVKCTRGDGDNYKVRTEEDFQHYDKNDVYDDGLYKQNYTK